MSSLALAFDVLARDKGATKTFDKVGDAADKAGRRGAKFGAIVGAGLGAAAVAAGKFAKDSIAAFKDSELSSARLDEALRKFPKTADVTRASLDELNSSLAKKTVFDDDATASGQAVLAQFNLTGAQIKQLTPLLQDYAAKTGKDLPTAAQELGKATLGQGKALKNIGINFKDAGNASDNYAQVVKGLRSQVGGFAEKEGKTAAGQAQILGNQYGELQEQVGAKLVPVLAKLATKLLEVVDFVSRNSAVIGPLVVTLGTAVGTFIALNKAIAVTNVVLKAMGTSTTVALGPIGLIVIAIAALTAGLVVAYKKSETFRNVVQGAFKAVGGFVLGAVDLILAGFEKMAEGLSHLPFVGDKFKGVAEGIEGVRTSIKNMKADLAQLGQKTIKVPIVLDVRAPGPLGKAAQAAQNSKLDRLGRARGGPVRAGQPYIVGEREPEWFVPDVSGRILNGQQSAAAGMGGGFSHNGDIIIQKADQETDAQAVSRAITNRAFLMGFV